MVTVQERESPQDELFDVEDEREINVLQIGSEWLPENTGGLQRMHFELHRHLPSHGIKSFGLVAGSRQIAKDTAGRVVGVSPADAPLHKRLQSFRMAAKWALDAYHPDVISSHFSLYSLPALDLFRSYPFVMHLHGPWALESRREGQPRPVTLAKHLIERIVYRAGTSFIVLSQAFKELFVTRYGVPPDKISVIPAGVDTGRFDTGLSRQQAAERLGWSSDRPLIFAVRRLVSRMGLIPLVKAVDTIRQVEPDILVHIAGTGPLRGKLEELILERDLDKHVRLLGFVPESDLALAYRAAHLSIVPTSSLEGMGCITLESLAAGTPVLVTPVGGLPEAVAPLSKNLVLEDTSVEAITRGIVDALKGHREIPSSEDCQSYVQANFDWHVISGRVANVYKRATR